MTIDVHKARAAAKADLLPELGTPEQVAEYLQTTVESLAQDRFNHRGPAYIKRGRRVLYRWADVFAYLDANRVDPGAA